MKVDRSRRAAVEESPPPARGRPLLSGARPSASGGPDDPRTASLPPCNGRTGAGAPDGSPGAPATKTPAGARAASTGTRKVTAGQPRMWRLDLPPGLHMLSLNGREHWAERHRRTQALKKAAWAMALQAKIPRLERVSVAAEYQPPDRRRRDSDNPVASVKAAIDGIVAAGVLAGDDSPRYVTEVTCRIGEPYPKGRLVLHLTEVPALRGNHPAGTKLPPSGGSDAA